MYSLDVKVFQAFGRRIKTLITADHAVISAPSVAFCGVAAEILY
jgi:hypothetical protein